MSDIRIVWDDAVAHGDWLLDPISSATERVSVSTPLVFGTGDGKQKQFQLLNPPFGDLTTQISMNDGWQGSQLLYPASRTNLLRKNLDLTNASYWWRTRIDAMASTLAPDGSQNAATITSNAQGSAYVYQSLNVVAGQSYEFSTFAKAGTGSVASFQNFTQPGGVEFYLSGDGATGATSGSLSNARIRRLKNGWYRCSAIFTASASGAVSVSVVLARSALASVSFFGPQILALSAGMAAPTSLISTDTAPVTVVDYGVSPAGVVTFGLAPAVNAALTWTGSYSKTRTVGSGDLESGADLVTAMLLSIFTDAMAASDDAIPDGTGDPRGWWGDQFDPGAQMGCKLWLLQREKQTQTTLNRAYDYLAEALKWLIDDGVVARFDIRVEWVRESFLGARIIAYSPGGNSLHTGKYLWAWNGIN